MTDDPYSTPPLDILRTSLRRRGSCPVGGFWGWFGRPLSSALAEIVLSRLDGAGVSLRGVLV